MDRNEFREAVPFAATSAVAALPDLAAILERAHHVGLLAERGDARIFVPMVLGR